MVSKPNIKQNLLGCFEIAIFMPKGFERFKDDRETALHSFKLFFIFVPLVLVAKLLLAGTYSSLLPWLAVAELMLTYVIFMSIVYLLCRQFNRLSYFYKYITIANWSNIITITMILPILVTLLMDPHAVEAFKTYAIFTTLVGYVYSAYIITHVLRIPWEMGACVAIVGMGLDQTAMDVTAYVQGLTHIA